MPDTLHLILWLVSGIAGGCAVGELFKERYDLHFGVMGYGALGGVIGALILQTLIPAVRGFDYGPIIGQLMIGFASGAVLTVIMGEVTRWRQNR